MNDIVISYRTMRRAIGIIALCFPLALILFRLISGSWIETSISAMYWTNSGIIFSSMLITMSVFLFSYNGFDRTDSLLTTFAALSLLIVAVFPCEGGTVYLISSIPPRATRVVHYVAAGFAFSFLGIMSMFQFTRGGFHTQKLKRNKVYRGCGYVIFGAIVAMLLLELIPGARRATDPVRLFYWLESVVVWSFGISWLVKGETIFKDK